MENKENMYSQNFKEKNTLLKKVCKFNIGLFIVTIVLSFVVYIIGVVSLINTTNTGIDGIGQVLGISIIIRLFQIICIVLIPLFIASICGLRYYKGKSKGKLTACWVWGFLSFFSSIFISYIVCDLFKSSFETQSLNGNNDLGFSIFASLVIGLFFLPNILYIVGCYKERFKTNIILEFIKSNKSKFIFVICIIFIILCLTIFVKFGTNNSEKIMVSNVTLPTLSEFENELKDRGFIYDIPEGYKELTSASRLTAEDNKYEHQYSLSFDKNNNEQYPVFIYGYTSLIEKSSKTAKYYTKGPEDWTITWDIYFVNGQIYAVIGEESELDKNWETDLFRTKYGRIVSEKEKITTYNRKGNYFSYGGGIEHNFTGYVRYLSTKMVDNFNSNCAEIIKVDRVDAKTLDRIAKELSPRYWLEYKNR